MRVLRAKILGFCSGVRRAVDIAWDESFEHCSDEPGSAEPGSDEDRPADAGRVYTLGPLIHNPKVLKVLGERGIGILDNNNIPRNAINSTVIIRAHGVSPDVEEKFSKQGMRILDATCPHVKESQNKALNYAKKRYKVFLAGEKEHGEITGIYGYAEAGATSSCIVVGDPIEAEEMAAEVFFEDQKAKTVLIGQTTFSAAEYRAMEIGIRKFFPDLVVLNTICTATAKRQKALKDLCRKVDAVIIAGGKESSNTRRLLALAQKLGKPAWLVEAAEDLPPEIKRYNTVGISAGASAPDNLVDEIENALIAFSETLSAE